MILIRRLTGKARRKGIVDETILSYLGSSLIATLMWEGVDLGMDP